MLCHTTVECFKLTKEKNTVSILSATMSITFTCFFFPSIENLEISHSYKHDPFSLRNINYGNKHSKLYIIQRVTYIVNILG